MTLFLQGRNTNQYQISFARVLFDNVSFQVVGGSPATPTNTPVVPPTPTRTPTDTPGPTATPTDTPVSGPLAAEDFDTMPSWSSEFDASWGSAALWAIVSGGQSGNYLRASRSSSGSSVKTQVFTVPANTDVVVSGYMRCPYFTGGYWAELACKPGDHGGSNFDSDPGSWTMIEKFDSYGSNPNGNGDTWTYYGVELNTGSNTRITIGYKLGSSGGAGPNVGWDTIRVEEAQYQAKTGELVPVRIGAAQSGPHLRDTSPFRRL
jgi:hypothetical protein